MLKITVSDRGRAVGQLELPAQMQTIKDQLETIRKNTSASRPLSVFDAQCAIPGFGWHLQYTKLEDEPTLEKLNRLAELIDGMNAVGLYHLSEALFVDYQQDLDDILQRAAHVKTTDVDNYETLPYVTTEQELGKWLVDRGRLGEKVPEALKPYLNYKAIGIDYRNEHKGVFLDDGYVGIRSGAMEQVMKGQSAVRLMLMAAKNMSWLFLPATDEQLEQTKRDLRIEGFAQASISAAEFSAPQLEELLPLDTVTVEDANALAECLQAMELEEDGLRKYCAALEAEQPATFSEALTIAMDLDDYELVPESMDEYGKQVFRRTGADDELIEAVNGYMDFAQLGEDSMEEDGVRRTEFGLVRRISAPFPAEEMGQTMV